MTPPTRVGAVIREAFVCDHANAELRRVRGADGSMRCLTMWCDDCRTHAAAYLGYDGIWISKNNPKVAHIDLETVPWLARETAWRRCQGPCKELADCQFHHLAPRAFFGDEADEWPTAWLCVSCHARWHTLATPGLCTAYDPTAHAGQLLGYLGVERAAKLTQALILAGRARRAGAA